MRKVCFPKVRKICNIEKFQNIKVSKFFIEHQDDCNEDAYIPSKKNRVQSVTESVFPFPSHLTASNKFRPRYRREYPDIVSAQPVHTRQAYGLFNFVPSRVRFIRWRIQTVITRLLRVWDCWNFSGWCFGEGKGRNHYGFYLPFLECAISRTKA